MIKCSVLFLLVVFFLLSCNRGGQFEKGGSGLIQDSTEVLMNEMRELDDSLKGLIVGIGVNRNCRFVNAESRDTLLSESVLQPGFLYIYLNQVQCDACVRQELALLRGAAVKDRFRVISSGAAIRSVRIFLSSNQITPDKAYVIIDSLGSIMERLTMPTMFQVDSEMRVKSEVHFGRVGFEAVTQRYLNGVKL